MFALLATVKSYVEGDNQVTLTHYIAPTTSAMSSYEASQTAANKVMGTYVSYPVLL